MNGKSILPVVCAIVVDDDKILAVKKSVHQTYPNKWEFPGGKVEPGETDKKALIREIAEELQIEIMVNMKLQTVFYEEANRIIELRPYLCERVLGDIQLNEHQEYKWMEIDALLHLDFAPADIPVAREVKSLLQAI